MKITLLVLCLGVSACASRADRVIAHASAGLAFDATYIPTDGGDIRALKFLEHRADWLGVQVEYRPEGHEDLRGATGLSYRQDYEKHVFIDQSLPINGRIEVLAHELGHMFQPPSDNRAANDVFAELVSVEVCARLGVPSAASSIRYIKVHKSAFAVAKIYAPEIRYVTDLLTRGYR